MYVEFALAVRYARGPAHDDPVLAALVMELQR